MSYEGWTNYATKLVVDWFSLETRADVELAREVIEEAENAVPDFLRDFLYTSKINWDELLEHFEEDGDDGED